MTLPGDLIRASALAALERFVDRARDPRWLEETLGISIDIDLAIFRHGQWFQRRSIQRQGASVVFESEGQGKGEQPRDVMRDFYAMWGAFAEETAFVDREDGPDEIVVTTIFGSLRELAHGHLVQFRLVGPRVRQVLRGPPEA